MISIGKTFLRWLALLVIVSFAMVVVQWLAAPEGYGANGWAHLLPQFGHPKLGKALLWLSESRSLHLVNRVGENVINAPRNELLRIFHIDAIGSYGSTFEYGEYNPPPTIVDGLLIKLSVALVTVFIYLPLTIGIALIRRSGWKAMKEPVLISSLLFVIAAISFFTVSGTAATRVSPARRSLVTAMTAMVREVPRDATAGDLRGWRSAVSSRG